MVVPFCQLRIFQVLQQQNFRIRLSLTEKSSSCGYIRQANNQPSNLLSTFQNISLTLNPLQARLLHETSYLIPGQGQGRTKSRKKVDEQSHLCLVCHVRHKRNPREKMAAHTFYPEHFLTYSLCPLWTPRGLHLAIFSHSFLSCHARRTKRRTDYPQPKYKATT